MFLPREKPNRLVIQLSGNYGKVLSVTNFSDTKQKQKLITILFKVSELSNFSRLLNASA